MKQARCSGFSASSLAALMIAAALWLGASGGAFAEVQVTAEISRNVVTIGSSLTYTIQISSSENIDTRLLNIEKMPSFQGLRLVSSSPNIGNRMQFVNGAGSYSCTLRWSLVAEKEGTGTIGAGEIRYGGRTYPLPAGQVKVVAAEQAGTLPPELKDKGILPANTDDANINKQLEGRLFARLLISNPNPYLQETVVVSCAVYGDEMNLLRQMVNFGWHPPAWGDFFAEQVDLGNQLSVRPVPFGGRQYYEVIVTQFLLTPTKVGKTGIPLTQAQANILVRTSRPSFEDDFFGGFPDPFSQRTIPIRMPIKGQTVEVKPLPTEGRPASFQNAVGQFSFAGRVDRSSMTEDDLLTLRLEVGGQGYLGSIAQPALPDLPGWSQVGCQTKTEALGQSKSQGGKKVFEVLLRPGKTGALSIPAIPYSFFDPSKGRYTEQTAGPFNVQVAKGKEQKLIVAGPQGLAAPRPNGAQFFGEQIAYIRTELAGQAASLPLYRQPWYLPLQLLPLILISGALGIRARREYLDRHADRLRVRGAGSRARRELRDASAALRKQDLDAFYQTLGEALIGYLATKLKRSAAGLTLEEMERSCLEKGVSAEAAAALRTLLETCDQARYVASSGGETDAREILSRTESLLRELDKAGWGK